MIESTKTIGESIRYYRECGNLSQEKLADFLMTTKQTISRYELGKSYLPAEAIKPLCSAFNITPNDFFGVSDNTYSINIYFNEIYEMVKDLTSEDMRLITGFIKLLKDKKQ